MAETRSWRDVTQGFRPLAVAAFESVFSPFRRARLHGPLIAGLPVVLEERCPVMLIANHASWWDGFVLRDVQRALRPGGRLFTLMTTRELRRHPYLRWMGCVGMEPGRRASVLAAFRRLRQERRRDSSAVFAFFPQGAIWPAGRRPLGFERGVSVLASLLAPVTLLPIGIHLEALNRAAPTAFVSLGRPVPHKRGRPDVRGIEAAVEAELDRIRHFLEAHGEAAPRLWAGAAR